MSNHEERMSKRPLSFQDIEAMEQEVQRQEARARKISDAHITQLEPEEMVDRLKGILYRTGVILRLAEVADLDLGGEILTNSLRSTVSGLVDVVKWLCEQEEMDPNSPFGDDTQVLSVMGLKLGEDLHGVLDASGMSNVDDRFHPRYDEDEDDDDDDDDVRRDEGDYVL